MARDYQSIGEVLVTLKTEFPDVTISKIRFLEGEGLIDPDVTAPAGPLVPIGMPKVRPWSSAQ